MPTRTAVYVLQFEPPVPEPVVRWVRRCGPSFARTVFHATTLPAAMNRAVEHFLHARREGRILLLHGSAIPPADASGRDGSGGHASGGADIWSVPGPVACMAKPAARCPHVLTCGALRIDREVLAGMDRPWFAQRLVGPSQELAGCPLGRLRERMRCLDLQAALAAGLLGRCFAPQEMFRLDPFAPHAEPLGPADRPTNPADPPMRKDTDLP